MKKTFDCLAMKEDIQRRLGQQMAGLSAEQKREAMRSALERSRSPVGDLWRALERRAAAGVGRVAEAGGAYGAGNEKT